MRLVPEQREFARVRVRLPIYWQRLTAEEFARLKPLFLQHPTHERQGGRLPTFQESPQLPADAVRPVEIAILQSLQLLHQKIDRLMALLQPAQQSASYFTGDSIDLSASGMRFLADLQAFRGESLEVRMVLPGTTQPVWSGRTVRPTPPNTIEVLANVVSASRSEGRWSIAVSFTAIHPADQQRIHQYCQNYTP